MKGKRSFKEEREYADLPRRIADLEAEQQRLQTTIAHPEFYREPADSIRQTMARIEAIDLELLAAYARWDELDSAAK